MMKKNFMTKRLQQALLLSTLLVPQLSSLEAARTLDEAAASGAAPVTAVFFRDLVLSGGSSAKNSYFMGRLGELGDGEISGINTTGLNCEEIRVLYNQARKANEFLKNLKEYVQRRQMQGGDAQRLEHLEKQTDMLLVAAGVDQASPSVAAFTSPGRSKKYGYTVQRERKAGAVKRNFGKLQAQIDQLTEDLRLGGEVQAEKSAKIADLRCQIDSLEAAQLATENEARRQAAVLEETNKRLAQDKDDMERSYQAANASLKADFDIYKQESEVHFQQISEKLQAKALTEEEAEKKATDLTLQLAKEEAAHQDALQMMKDDHAQKMSDLTEEHREKKNELEHKLTTSAEEINRLNGNVIALKAQEERLKQLMTLMVDCIGKAKADIRKYNPFILKEEKAQEMRQKIWSEFQGTATFPVTLENYAAALLGGSQEDFDFNSITSFAKKFCVLFTDKELLQAYNVESTGALEDFDPGKGDKAHYTMRSFLAARIMNKNAGNDKWLRTDIIDLVQKIMVTEPTAFETLLEETNSFNYFRKLENITREQKEAHKMLKDAGDQDARAIGLETPVQHVTKLFAFTAERLFPGRVNFSILLRELRKFTEEAQYDSSSDDSSSDDSGSDDSSGDDGGRTLAFSPVKN
ncbi:hypothetical protein OAN22_01425 [Alphaproteobacteria bacterium]|nr:hypothetical protein [Alphaproteobacteria bacterium]MDC0344797.1 hypothetical protein [Alphaproteobacteria bacterium]